MTTVTTPSYPQYTNLPLEGGLFDQLMSTVKHHLQEEYDAQRLKGTDYAKVYVGSMEAVMQNTTTYLLGILLLEEQKDKVVAETALIDAQTSKTDQEIVLLGWEIKRVQYEVENLLPAQLNKLLAEIAVLELQDDLVAAQILKITAEIDMLESQKLLIDAQILKINQEILFLDAKIATEYANTIDGAGGLIGKQMSLLTAQKYGFAGDIEVKVAKLHADYAAVWQSVQEDETIPFLSGTATGSNTTGSIAAIKNA